MIYLFTLAGAGVWMLLAWLVSLPKRDVSIVDAFWGPGFLVVTAIAHLLSEGWGPRRLLVLALVAVWGLRLGIYLLRRNLAEGEEDYRYRKMRDRWGKSFPLVSLGTVFLLQALLCWFIALPLIVIQKAPGPQSFTGWDVLGVILWAVGLFFEAVGDWQLSRFKADPANEGEVLDTGLWRYTRHPNYFGDFLVWWGFFAIALAVPGGWMTLASPVVMSILLMKVSGVGLLEKKLSESKPKYAEYRRRTNAFFPGPPGS